MKKTEIISLVLSRMQAEHRKHGRMNHDEWMKIAAAKIATSLEEYATQQKMEIVPNLSELGKTETDKFIIDFVQMTAKNVLSVFVALGLETHIEATVVNDANGSKYKLSFIKEV